MSCEITVSFSLLSVSHANETSTYTRTELSQLNYATRSDNISPRLEEMVRNHYTELPFPADLAGFGSLLAIYVRKY